MRRWRRLLVFPGTAWGLLAILLLAAPTLARPKKQKDPLPRVRKHAEFKYVDEKDDAKAEARLAKLLAKYDTPAKCARLLKILEKRPYPSRVPSRLTLDHACLDGKTRQFTWIAPAKYSKRRPTGVVVFLHGAVSQPPPGGGANEAGMFAPAFRDLNVILVGPSTYEGHGWDEPACRELVHHALRTVKEVFNVDEDRVWIAGDSDGGRGTYALVETEATFFAAAVPVIGAPGGVTRFANLKNLPFFAINGEKDTTFPLERVQQAVEGMQAAGIDVRFQVVPGQGHDPRYLLKFRDEICDFLRKHPRDPLPHDVDWQVDPGRKDDDGGFPANTFRWIRIDETGSAPSRGSFDEKAGSLVRRGLPRIKAHVEGNHVEVKTRQVKRFTVLVHPDLFDLGKPIEITVNGRPAFEGLVQPDARAILEEARRFADRKLLFVNRIEVDVTALDETDGGG